MSIDGRSQRPIWLGEDRRQWDHVRLHVQLLHDVRLDAYDLAVYLGIAAHAEVGTGSARPSEATLAAYAQISERKARGCVKKMESLGYIAVQHRLGKASVYTLQPPPELSTPRHEVPGSADDLGTSRQRPRHLTTQTPARGSDELEVNKNKERERYWAQPVDNSAAAQPPPFGAQPEPAWGDVDDDGVAVR